MSLDDDDKKKRIVQIYPVEEHHDEEEGGDESGGKSGAIEFHEFMGTAPLRDDLLSGEELKRLQTIHATENEVHVRKAKDEMTQRKQLKEGKISLGNFRKNTSARGTAKQYKTHPALANMSGRDPKVSNDPNINNAETNEDKKKLVLNYDLRHELKQKPTPTFIPPQPRPR